MSVSAPFGIPFWQDDANQVWISYGVGSAVFISAIRSFPTNYSSKVHYICCDRLESNIFFKNELVELAENNANFTWEEYIGSGQEFVANFARNNLLIKNYQLFRICGHPGFQNSLRGKLINNGVKSKFIHLEGL